MARRVRSRMGFGVSATALVVGAAALVAAVSGTSALAGPAGDRAPARAGIVPGLTGVTAVSEGDLFSLALKGDGTVWAWGVNDLGQLGDGTTDSSDTPVQVENLTGVVAISAGGFHSLALRTDGTVWAWGSDRYGQLGDAGSEGFSPVPVRVLDLGEAVAVAAGGQFSLAIRADRTAVGWGENGLGQLGEGSTSLRVSTPRRVRRLSNVQQVAAGDFFTLAVLADGTVWACGSDDHGQLGDGRSGVGLMRTLPYRVQRITGALQVSAGEDHSLALLPGGAAAWGDNGAGELGIGSVGDPVPSPARVRGLPAAVAVAAGAYLSAGLLDDGTIDGWGGTSDVPKPVAGLTGVRAIALGGGEGLALLGDGTVATFTP
jgi:alpha-tubulin suppressor-like RCC1 family protein